MEIVIFLTIKNTTKHTVYIYTRFEKIFELTRKIVCSIFLVNSNIFSNLIYIYRLCFVVFFIVRNMTISISFVKDLQN